MITITIIDNRSRDLSECYDVTATVLTSYVNVVTAKYNVKD